MLAAAACTRTETSPTAAPIAGGAPKPLEQATQPPPPAAPAQVTIPAGKSLRVRTASTLSTKTARNGEQFTAVLATPLVVDGITLAPAGATVNGVVAHSNPGGRVKGVASIGIRATELQLAGGQTIPLTTGTYVKSAPHTKKKDALKVGIGSGIGAAIGAIAGGGKGAAIGAGAGAGAGTGAVLATHGDAAVIPSESLVTFTLRRPVTVDR